MGNRLSGDVPVSPTPTYLTADRAERLTDLLSR
jgi:hypothetical protein